MLFYIDMPPVLSIHLLSDSHTHVVKIMLSRVVFLCAILFMIGSTNGRVDGGSVTGIEGQASPCHRSMNLSQVVELLQQRNRIGKRDTHNTGTVDIHALQTTVNDHHTLINYIINNSLNTSFLTEAVNRQNAQRPPMLTEWRDCVDMACIAFIVGALVYLLICRTGCTSCGAIMAFFLRPVATHLNRQMQVQTPSAVIETVSHKVQPIQPPIGTDVRRYNHGYNSD